MSRTVVAHHQCSATLRILLVEPSLRDQRFVRSLLQKGERYRVYSARDLATARRLLDEGGIDLALVESGFWRDQGAELVRVLRGHRPDVAIVVLTSGEDEREALPALKLGAHDFVSKRNLDSAQLDARILLALEESRALRRRDTMVRWLEREARTDHLTGFYNRRAFDEHLREACARASEGGATVTLVLIDVVGIRAVNEAHGHEAGDDVIRRAAQAIARCTRGADFAARVGGDDLAIVLAEGDLEVGRRVARRIVHEVDRLNAGEWRHELPVSLAFGVAAGLAPAADDLFAAAEEGVLAHRQTRPVAHHYPFWEENDGPSVA